MLHRTVIVTLLLPWLLPCAVAGTSKVVGHFSAGCFRDNSHGFRELERNSTCHKRLVQDGRVVVDGVATTDEYGRRKIELSASQIRSDQFVAFLGCSFTYGEGVGDSENFPAQLARHVRDWAVYNYGDPGYGPANVFEMLGEHDLAKEIPQRRGKFVYLWISDHAWRVVGSLTRQYTDDYPYYVLDSAGQPVLRGSLRSAHPLRYWLFDLLRRWKLGERLGFNIPPRITDADLRLDVALFKSIDARLTQAKPGSEFDLVIYPEGGDPVADKASAFFHTAFAETPIHVIDWNVRDPFQGISGPQSLPDGHPGPERYRRMASALINELKLK